MVVLRREMISRLVHLERPTPSDYETCVPQRLNDPILFARYIYLSLSLSRLA